VGAALRRRRGGGRPRDRVAAHRFGRGFGADLSAVRLHTDAEADGLARSVQATAFTYGSDVYFSRGSFSPGTQAGDHLMAHELAHVVQGTVGAWNSPGAPGEPGGPGVRIGRAGDPAEVAADAAADAVMTRLQHADETQHAPAPQGPAPQPVAGTVRRSSSRHLGGVATAAAPEVIRRDDTVVDDRTAPPTTGGWTEGTSPSGARTGGLELGKARQQGAPRQWAPGQAQIGPRLPRGLTTERDPVKRFRAIVESAGAPDDAAVARQRMVDVRAFLKGLSTADRTKISQDKDLIAKGRTYVGPKEYISLLAAVGMYTPKTKKDGTKKSMHMTGAEADVFIRDNMGAIPHLKPYLDEAVKAGKQGEGFIATLDKSDWDLVYVEEFPDEAIGSDDEKYTNAFASTENKDEPAILHADRGTRSTAIHESMHRYASDAINVRWGFSFNEGVTEYFTRLLTDKNGEPASKGGPSRNNYQSNFTFVSSMISILGSNKKERETVLAEMNFRGKTDLLKTKFLSAVKKSKKLTGKPAESAWNRFSAALRKGRWDDASAELR
jgi:hypothetical protein